MTDGNAVPDTQRIDRWLWHARFFKTRTLASKFVTDGKVRITRDDDTFRAEKPSTTVRPGDVLVFSRNDVLRIVEILQCAARRGPASEARTLYDDQSPPQESSSAPKEEKSPQPFAREKGAGRPTKKDRRALNAMKANHSGSA